MSFRTWLQEMWMRHKDENSELGIKVTQSNLEEYFQMYKWWLKREYKHWRNTNE